MKGQDEHKYSTISPAKKVAAGCLLLLGAALTRVH